MKILAISLGILLIASATSASLIAPQPASAQTGGQTSIRMQVQAVYFDGSVRTIGDDIQGITSFTPLNILDPYNQKQVASIIYTIFLQLPTTNDQVTSAPNLVTTVRVSAPSGTFLNAFPTKNTNIMRANTYSGTYWQIEQGTVTAAQIQQLTGSSITTTTSISIENRGSANIILTGYPANVGWSHVGSTFTMQVVSAPNPPSNPVVKLPTDPSQVAGIHIILDKASYNYGDPVGITVTTFDKMSQASISGQVVLTVIKADGTVYSQYTVQSTGTATSTLNIPSSSGGTLIPAGQWKVIANISIGSGTTGSGDSDTAVFTLNAAPHGDFALPPPQGCGASSQYNPTTNSCTPCPSGTIYSAVTGSCAPSGCPSGTILSNTGTCVPTPCTPTQTYNPSTNTCTGGTTPPTCGFSVIPILSALCPPPPPPPCPSGTTPNSGGIGCTGQFPPQPPTVTPPPVQPNPCPSGQTYVSAQPLLPSGGCVPNNQVTNANFTGTVYSQICVTWVGSGSQCSPVSSDVQALNPIDVFGSPALTTPNPNAPALITKVDVLLTTKLNNAGWIPTAVTINPVVNIINSDNGATIPIQSDTSTQITPLTCSLGSTPTSQGICAQPLYRIADVSVTATYIKNALATVQNSGNFQIQFTIGSGTITFQATNGQIINVQFSQFQRNYPFNTVTCGSNPASGGATSGACTVTDPNTARTQNPTQGGTGGSVPTQPNVSADPKPIVGCKAGFFCFAPSTVTSNINATATGLIITGVIGLGAAAFYIKRKGFPRFH